MEQRAAPQVAVTLEEVSQCQAEDEGSHHEDKAEGHMHQGEEKGCEDDAQCFLVLNPHQGFHAGLDHAPR